ncbi:nicotinate-nucleotide adenylyltransferase [Sporosarcina sp. P12(2017)]|uniref:Probable nicotinate-nucleotide adenylyltransferase n=1 Tax=Sporosarcina ureae TaxID=1571 RepID=A0ABN4YXF4_SPOUR|nr:MULTISPECIES: nicotinate-nucleotide adenylyltransferase [Sporosarcina]ARF15570.1 nicotinic acid mononucleotide adenylyltransferase [Sporosarcina ureae]PIC58995.1 nicotinate-nucleotide adenylyltransferase [Sporosarcina sp. P10]PIC62315.1 nicotinate-nucleotide adenylyltransferase [Sporosarcina sp. P12(2017)]PIC78502.1 nicotinate-nucleotide adenylyltransferase [Sporosarcina sp. P19]
MKRIGILGGTFNPPHTGHLLIANEVRYALQLDEVWLMPTAVPPHKVAVGDATAEQRLQMVKLAVDEVDGLRASSFEMERGGVSFTYDTMSQLVQDEADVHFHFIIGGDMIDQLPTWYRIEDLLDIVTFIGVKRPGADNASAIPVQLVETPQLDLSSTLIRQRFVEGGTVQLLIPPAVEAYIREERLYGSTTS